MTDPLHDRASLAQAFLFAEGGTLSIKRLESLLNCDRADVVRALQELRQTIAGSGLALIQTETEATLAVAPAQSEALKSHYEKELGKEIGDAGLEVLAIVLYRGASTRSQIDYIRGVNTSSTIRNLLSRGLIERASNPADSREYLYRPTTELLAHLGVTDMTGLPERDKISAELQAFEEKRQAAGPFDENAGH